jgi:glycerol kinase
MAVCTLSSFVGMGAPYWRRMLVVQFLDDSLCVKKEHIIRAVKEWFYGNRCIWHYGKGCDIPLSIMADGWSRRNQFLMQFVAVSIKVN